MNKLRLVVSHIRIVYICLCQISLQQAKTAFLYYFILYAMRDAICIIRVIYNYTSLFTKQVAKITKQVQ